jgi:hypothetical protein
MLTRRYFDVVVQGDTVKENVLNVISVAKSVFKAAGDESLHQGLATAVQATSKAIAVRRIFCFFASANMCHFNDMVYAALTGVEDVCINQLGVDHRVQQHGWMASQDCSDQLGIRFGIH